MLQVEARKLLAAAGFLVLVCLLLLASSLFLEDPPGVLAATAKAIGALAGLVGIASGVTSLREARNRPSAPIDVRSVKLRSEQSVVDRTDQVGALTAQLKQHNVVNCHGPRGAGKSFMLQYLADVLNGHRLPNPHHQWPHGISAALYFDLADAIGFAGLESQVCRTIFGQDGTWRQFINYAVKRYPRSVLVILDNVNSESLWSPVGRAIYEYLLARDGDSLIVGSIDQLSFDNLMVGEVDVGGLDIGAFAELTQLEGLRLDADAFAELYRRSDGLPYYAGPRGARHAALAERVELAPGTRRLVAYAALAAVTARRIPLRELEHWPIANSGINLENAVKEKLVELTADGLSLTMHDITRDDALAHYHEEVLHAAAMLFERARHRDDIRAASVFAMFCDPAQIGEASLDEVLQLVIRAAVDSRDYALLETLYEKSRSNELLLEFLIKDSDRFDLFSYGRAAQLAGLGAYEGAEAELLETSISSMRGGRGEGPSELQLELAYMQADIAHLLNRYDEAATGFEMLGDVASSFGFAVMHTKCLWAQAHVLRHQGRDLERAVTLFEQAEALSEQQHLLPYKSLTITGASMIRVFWEQVPDDEEERLERLEHEVAASHAHDGHMLGIWKALAQVDWIRGRKEQAATRVKDAIEKAKALNDRLLYDLLFERAEFLRLTGECSAALEDYDRAFRFGTGNRDRNMTSIALLGLVLADLSLGRCQYHGSRLEARGSVLRARDIALEADIQVTRQLAERIAASLDGPSIGPQIRLINF